MGIPERIKEIRLKLSLNQSEFANKLNVSRSIVSEFENSAREPSKEFLLSLHALGVSLDWFLSGEGEIFNQNRLNSNPFAVSDFPTKELTIKPVKKMNEFPIIKQSIPEGFVIPLLDQAVSAGAGKTLEDQGLSDRFVSVPQELSRYESLSALPVRGDSMTPTLHEGDLVVCDAGGWDGDGVYVIKTQELAFVKRVVLTPTGFNVISDNKLYPSYSGSKDEVKIVGKVRCAVVRVE